MDQNQNVNNVASGAATISSFTSNTASELSSQAQLSSMKAKSTDVGWDYAVKVDPKSIDKLKCLLCGKQMSGGINQMKQHIAHIKGNVSSCPKSTAEDKSKCLKHMKDVQFKKNKKTSSEEEVIMEEAEMEMEEEGGGLNENYETIRKKQKYLGPMDSFASNIDRNKYL